MKSSVFCLTLVATIGLLNAPVSFAADKPAVSKAVAKPLKSAQEAIEAKKYVDGLAKLKEVEAIPGKSPYDEYLINELRGFAAARAKDYPEAARAYEETLDSGYVDQGDVPPRVRMLTQLYYTTKNFDKALEFGNRAIKGGFADDEIYTTVGQAYYLKGDYRGTQRFIEGYVDNQVKRGQVPKEQSLQLILSSCSKLQEAREARDGDEPPPPPPPPRGPRPDRGDVRMIGPGGAGPGESDCMTRTLERLVAHYPKTDYWRGLLYSMLQAPEESERNKLQVYRLASEVDVLKLPDYYTEMAQIAIDQGSPGEAVRILQKGFDKKIFVDPRSQDKNRRLLAMAQRKAAVDQASLDRVEKDAAASPTGEKDISVGLAYLSYQQYDKAIAAFTRGLAKPGVRNEAEARLLLGIAQLEGGKKDEAMKSFRAVKGDPKLERLASLWSLHARQA